VIFVPDGKTHLKINWAFLVVFNAIVLFKGFINPHDTLIFTVSYLIGTYLLNPDLDTHSDIRKRWWIFGFIWKPFDHRGIMHNPLMWIGVHYAFYYFGYTYYFAGVMASALVHIAADWFMDLVHKIL